MPDHHVYHAGVTLNSEPLARYELFIDDLPVWGFVGPPPEESKDDKQIYIYAHKSFDINYNENRARRARFACRPHEAPALA